MRLPSGNPITFGYGATSYPYSASNPHAGSDFGYAPDPDWYAPEPCTVTLVTSGSTCGKQVDLLSLDGRRKYRGCHSSTIYVAQGQRLSEGQKVARMGDTGYAFGAHLHFVMWVDGVRVDCTKYLKGVPMAKDTTIKQVFQMGLYRNPDSGALTTYRQTSDEVLVSSVYGSTERANKLKALGISGFDVPGRISGLIGANTALKSEVDTLKAKNKSLQGTVADQGVALEESQAKITELSNRIAELEKQLQESQQPPSEVEGWLRKLIEWIKGIWKQ